MKIVANNNLKMAILEIQLLLNLTKHFSGKRPISKHQTTVTLLTNKHGKK